nr:unnamed protein product [Digitaria exilis]
MMHERDGDSRRRRPAARVVVRTQLVDQLWFCDGPDGGVGAPPPPPPIVATRCAATAAVAALPLAQRWPRSSAGDALARAVVVPPLAPSRTGLAPAPHGAQMMSTRMRTTATPDGV